MTGFPVLLGQDMAAQMVIQPVTYRLRENLTPLSTASITVLDTVADLIPMRSFMRLYSPNGCAGVYRVISRSTSAGMSAELTLQHALCTLSDHMHHGKSDETSSCRALLENLLSNQDRWVLGTVDVPDDEPLTWSCNDTNDLQGLTDIMKELPGYFLDFDQTALPWVLHVRRKPEDVQCEARMERNLIDAQIVVDTSEMCNVAYADGLPEPIVADTVDTWGRIERKVSAADDLPADMLDKTVRRYLDTHKDPRITITLTAVELSRLTGEPLDRFRLGTLCRCIIDGTETVQRIESIDWRDPIGTPEDVVLTLSSTQKDMSVTVAGLVVDTRVRFEQMRGKLLVEAKQIAFLSEQILLRATKEEADLLSTRISVVEIDMNKVAGDLTLKASQGTVDELSNKVSSAELRLSAAESLIEAKADLILLEGYVKATDLKTETLKVLDGATLASLKTGAFNCSGRATMSEVWASGAVITNLNAPNAILNGSDYAAHSHAVSVGSDGTVKLGEVSSSGGSFNIADTSFYKDGVSAAINSVTLTSMGWQGGVNNVKASNGKELSIALPAFSTSGGDSFTSANKTTVYFYTDSVQGYLASREVDATSVYDAGYQAAKDAYYDSRYQDGYDDGVLAGYDNGYAAGYQAAKDAVTVEGGITSITNPAQGYYIASGWAAAMLDGEQIDYTTFRQSQQFG